MKEIVIILIIIIVVFFANDISCKYIYNSTNELINELEEFKIKIIQEKEAQTISKINDIDKKWKETKEVLSVFVHHNHIDDVDVNLVAIKAGIEMSEIDNIMVEIDKTIFALTDIQEINKLKMKNIF